MGARCYGKLRDKMINTFVDKLSFDGREGKSVERKNILLVVTRKGLKLKCGGGGCNELNQMAVKTSDQ